MSNEKMTPPEVLAVLQHHVSGMSAASQAGGLTFTTKACANTAREMESARTAVAALIAERDDLRTELRTMIDYANSPDFDGAPSRAAYERAVAVLERAESGNADQS